MWAPGKRSITEVVDPLGPLPHHTIIPLIPIIPVLIFLRLLQNFWVAFLVPRMSDWSISKMRPFAAPKAIYPWWWSGLSLSTASFPSKM